MRECWVSVSMMYKCSVLILSKYERVDTQVGVDIDIDIRNEVDIYKEGV